MLPPEILDQIYDDLPHQDILTCQYVCHSWHTPAKRKFYDLIEFKTSISVSLFNYCMSQSRLPTIPAPGLFVRQVVFNETNRINGHLSLTLTQHHVHTLARFCPNIQVIECSSFLNNLVLESLLSMPDDVSLSHLECIPIHGELYPQCAAKYSPSLIKLYMDTAIENLPYLQSFTNLSSLEIQVNDTEKLVAILNIQPQLVELRASIIGGAASKRQYLQHPLLLETLRLEFMNGTSPRISAINDMMKHMHYLKDFVLVADDVDADFATLVKTTHKIENATMTVFGQDHKKTSGVALEYIGAVFQPLETQWYTSLMITNNNMRGYGICESLKYEISRANNERTVSILLPDIESEDRVLHTHYIEGFALDVNDLIINYEGTPLNQNGCDYFLETVIEQCQRLTSLTLICGNYSDWGCSVINPSVYRISLIASFLSPTFFHTLSRVCPCLKRLEIYKCHVSRMNDMIHYYMPETSLEEIEFNLDQFKLGNFYSRSSMILKVILKSRQKTLYFYTNYDDIYMTEWTRQQGELEWRNQESLSVIMEFNDIQKLRATYFGIPGIEVNLANQSGEKLGHMPSS